MVRYREEREAKNGIAWEREECGIKGDGVGIVINVVIHMEEPSDNDGS